MKGHARAYLRLLSSARRLFITTRQRGQNEPSGPPWPWLHLHFSLHPSVTYGKCAVEEWHLLIQRTFFDARRSCPTHEGLGNDDRKWASRARRLQLRLDRASDSPFCCGKGEARTVSSGLNWRGSSKRGTLASGNGRKPGNRLEYPHILRVDVRKESDTCGEYALAQGGRVA